MVSCPHCGDDEARPGGFCPACGEKVPDLAAEVMADLDLADTLSFDQMEMPTTAVPPPPLPVRPAAPQPPPPAPPAPPPRQPRAPRRGAKVRRKRAPRGVTKKAVPGFDTSEITVAVPVPQETGAEAHASLDLSARFELTSVPVDDPPVIGVLLTLESLGQPLRRVKAAPVAHVILALDLSASMDQPDKYPVLKSAVEGMLEDLRAPGAGNVLLSVVIFSRGSAIVLRDTPARKVEPRALFHVIEQHHLCFGTYTEIAGALSKAGRIAYDQSRADRTLPVRIYLLTDGRPQNLEGTKEIAEKVGQVPCDVHALAFGGDADVAILQDLFAGRRGGTVKSVRRETLEFAFERVAETAQRVVATRCQLEVELAPGVVGGEVFRYRPARVRYPGPAFAGGKVFRTDLGSIEADRKYSLLFEIRPPEREETVTNLGRATVRIPGYGGPIETTIPLTLSRTEAGTLPGEVDAGVRTARDILGALTDADPKSALRALTLRRKLYEQEKRDPALLAILDKAIALLRKTGSLEGLSPDDHATLMAHTCTSGSDGGP